MDEAWLLLGPAVVVGGLASLAFGLVGSYVVAARVSYLAGALAHAILGGIGAAVFAERVLGWNWMSPRLGALGAGLLGALVMAWVSRERGREDSLISVIWALGMAIGLLFFAVTPGYVEPMAYLFGNILVLTPRDAWTVAGLDAAILAVGTLGYTRLRAACFDEEFAELRGLDPRLSRTVLLVLTAVTVVLLVQVVGVVLVVALLTLPAALGGHYSRTLAGMMVRASGLCLAFTWTGLALSYGMDLPAGPIIIVLAAVGYLLGLLVRRT